MRKKWVNFVVRYLCIMCLISGCVAAFVYLNHNSVKKTETVHAAWDKAIQEEYPQLEQALERYQHYWVILPARWRLLGQGVTQLCLQMMG